jgi:hypothetical protein
MIPLLILFFISLASTSISTSNEWPETTLLPFFQDPERINYLYCGTIARGPLHLTPAHPDQASDVHGFVKGVQEILKVYEKSNKAPILDTQEYKYLRNRLFQVFKRNFSKHTLEHEKPAILSVCWNFLTMQTTHSEKLVSLATILSDIKHRKNIMGHHFESTLRYLNSFDRSIDFECTDLIDRLIISVKNRNFFIPDFSTQEDKTHAIIQGIKQSALLHLGTTEILVLYFYVQYIQYSKTQIFASYERSNIAIQMLCKNLKFSIFTERPMRQKLLYSRSLVAVIIKKKGYLFGGDKDADRWFGILDLTDEELLEMDRLKRVIDDKTFTSKGTDLLLEAVFADIFDMTHPYTATLLEKFNKNENWNILCPGIDVVKKHLEEVIEKE